MKNERLRLEHTVDSLREQIKEEGERSLKLADENRQIKKETETISTK